MGAFAIFGPPALAVGLVLGWIVGAETGKPTESQPQPRKLVDELRGAVPPGGSAIVLLAAPDHVDSMLEALSSESGEVTRHTLDDEQVAELEAALSDSPPAAPPPS